MSQILSIAVLPFLNMSSDKDNEYFSDGVTEEIINTLGKIRSLKVTSRTSSFFFKGKDKDIRTIAKTLNVSMLLEGSVRKSANNVRVTAQLINAEDGFHFWSETYDHSLEDIFLIQDKISFAVADKMREHLGHFEITQHESIPNTNIDNYELFLKSKYNFNKFQKEDLKLAVSQIEEVIKSDPSHSYYHASKAIYYGYMGLFGIIPQAEAFSISKSSAKKALEIDKSDPEANYSLALVAYFFEKDLNKAQEGGNLAIKYRPSYTDALMGGSVIDVLTNNYDRAISRLMKAREIDPLSPTILYYHAAALLRMGKYEEGLIVINDMLKLTPSNTNSYCLKGVILTRLGRYAEAVEHYKSVPKTSDETEIYYSGIGIAYATQGDRDSAKEYLSKIKLDQKNFSLAYEENAEVIINIYLGNLDAAFRELVIDIKAKKYYLNFYAGNPAFDLLKNDPRYSVFESIFITKGVKESSSKRKDKKYKKSGLSEGKRSLINDKLMSVMKNDKPFLDSDISLRRLSEAIDESANNVSQLINDLHEMNFFDFINLYRIEEMTALLKIPANNNLTLLALAYEAGFNSKTTFNAAFKKLKEQTPSAYYKSIGLI